MAGGTFPTEGASAQAWSSEHVLLDCEEFCPSGSQVCADGLCLLRIHTGLRSSRPALAEVKAVHSSVLASICGCEGTHCSQGHLDCGEDHRDAQDDNVSTVTVVKPEHSLSSLLRDRTGYLKNKGASGNS